MWLTFPSPPPAGGAGGGARREPDAGARREPDAGRRRLLLFFLATAAFASVYQLGAMSDVGEEEAEAFLEEFGKIVEGIDAVGIFLHNTSLALPMFLPGFGIVWGMFSAWSTGYAFASIAAANPVALAGIPPLAVLFLSPFGLLELAAYSIAVSRSFLLAARLLRRKPLMPVLPVVGLEVVAVAGLLLVGALVEFQMIESLMAGPGGAPAVLVPEDPGGA